MNFVEKTIGQFVTSRLFCRD